LKQSYVNEKGKTNISVTDVGLKKKSIGISLLRHKNLCMFTEAAPPGFHHCVWGGDGISKVYFELFSQSF
jgi:hypothetical protein